MEQYDEIPLSYGNKCIDCGQVLPTSAFRSGVRKKDGPYTRKACELCVSLRKYRMNRTQYLAQLERQGGVCWICKTDTPGGAGRWHVDHNHACCDKPPTCGECNRALLCNHCNTGLGFFKDDSDILRRAADYLEFEYM